VVKQEQAQPQTGLQAKPPTPGESQPGKFVPDVGRTLKAKLAGAGEVVWAYMGEVPGFEDTHYKLEIGGLCPWPGSEEDKKTHTENAKVESIEITDDRNVVVTLRSTGVQYRGQTVTMVAHMSACILGIRSAVPAVVAPCLKLKDGQLMHEKFLNQREVAALAAPKGVPFGDILMRVETSVTAGGGADPKDLALLHSTLNDPEYTDEARKIRMRRIFVTLGQRAAGVAGKPAPRVGAPAPVVEADIPDVPIEGEDDPIPEGRLPVDPRDVVAQEKVR